MNKKELKLYLKTLTFGLKDFDKTNTKRKDYKKDDYKTAITNNKYQYNNFINDIESDIECNLFNQNHYYQNLLDNLKEDLSKSNIRQLKTYINNTTKTLNKNSIERLLEQENIVYNKYHSFDIVFYIKHYKKINKAMHNVLKLVILNLY